jgi:hypothetical protein
MWSISSWRPRQLVYDIITGNEIRVGGVKLDEPVGNAETRPRCAEVLEAARTLHANHLAQRDMPVD